MVNSRTSGDVIGPSLADLSHRVGLAVGDHGGGVVQEPVEYGYGPQMLRLRPREGTIHAKASCKGALQW